jgi:hypothetical protein
VATHLVAKNLKPHQQHTLIVAEFVVVKPQLVALLLLVQVLQVELLLLIALVQLVELPIVVVVVNKYNIWQDKT